MKINNKDMLLYLVTDRTWLRDKTLSEVVELTINNGVTFVQIREKTLDHESFKNLAIDVKKITDKHKIPFVINDNIKLALEVDADGVHIGQEDMTAYEARKILGQHKILGVSVGNVKEAIEAEKAGADYLGVGAMFPTTSKSDAISVEIEELKNITESVNIPVVAIGGINQENIQYLKNSGINGVAVISAILAKDDMGKATEELRKVTEEYLK